MYCVRLHYVCGLKDEPAERQRMAKKRKQKWHTPRNGTEFAGMWHEEDPVVSVWAKSVR